MDEAVRLLTEVTYNKLSEERANAAYMWRNTNKNSYYEKWVKYLNDTRELEESVYSEGYEFVATGTKVKGEVQSDVYSLVKVNKKSPSVTGTLEWR